MYYRKEILADLGVEPPKTYTYNEMLCMANKKRRLSLFAHEKNNNQCAIRYKYGVI